MFINIILPDSPGKRSHAFSESFFGDECDLHAVRFREGDPTWHCSPALGWDLFSCLERFANSSLKKGQRKKGGIAEWRRENLLYLVSPYDVKQSTLQTILANTVLREWHVTSHYASRSAQSKGHVTPYEPLLWVVESVVSHCKGKRSVARRRRTQVVFERGSYTAEAVFR